MTEDKIPHWRDGKNARIEARDKTRAEELAKEHKNKKSELDDPTHWRYRKSQGISHGTTTTKDIIGKKEKKELPNKVPPSKVPPKEEKVEPKNRVFTKETAKDLNRDQQEEILVQRFVKFTSKDKEDDLIKKIIKSNPKKV